jgi:hypothetical protein
MQSCALFRLMREVQVLVHDRETMRQQHEAQIVQIRACVRARPSACVRVFARARRARVHASVCARMPAAMTAGLGGTQSQHVLAHERDALSLQIEQLSLEKHRLQEALSDRERQASSVRAEHQATIAEKQATIAALQERERALSHRLGVMDESTGSLLKDALKEKTAVVEQMQEQGRQIAELAKREELLAKRVEQTVAELAKERKMREFFALRAKDLELELAKIVPPRSAVLGHAGHIVSHAEPARYDAMGHGRPTAHGASHYEPHEPAAYSMQQPGPVSAYPPAHPMAVSAEANATLNDWIASFSKAAPQTREVGEAISAAREQEMKIWHETLLNKLKRVVKKVDRRLKSATDQFEDMSGDSSDGRGRSVSLADLQELKEAQRSLDALLRERR